VMLPATYVDPHAVGRPEASHGKSATDGPQSSNNWSGFELLRPLVVTGTLPIGVKLGPPYDWITGTWHVPSVTGEANTTTNASLWVGLDGDGTADLVQAGTEQQSVTANFGVVTVTLSAYYAWTEFLPQQPTEQQLTNFPVNPGDEIMTQVWIGNAGSAPTISGAFGVFLLYNLTQSVYTRVYTPVGTTKVGGGEAVWIMERPRVAGALADLSDYGSTVMYNAYARSANSARGRGYVPYQGARNKQITMVNGKRTLSTVSPIDAYSMRFDWQAFH